MRKIFNKYLPKAGIQTLSAGHTNLGEGAMWHPDFKKFFYTDIWGQKICSYDPKDRTQATYNLSGTAAPGQEVNVSSLAPTKLGFACSFNIQGFGKIDFPSLKLEFFGSQPCAQTQVGLSKFNDGKCDPRGRYVAGLFSNQTKGSHFYILDSKARAPRVLIEDLACSNGASWSLDGKTMYYVDTFSPPAYCADYDLENGTLSNRRVFMETSDYVGGFFDGATVDKDGYVWWAIFAGGRVLRIDPRDGSIERTIDLEADAGIQSPTCVAFGGEDYRTLIVTSECWQPGQVDPRKGKLQNGAIAVINFDESENIQGVAPAYFNEN
jgi:L-arabinonolactonase